MKSLFSIKYDENDCLATLQNTEDSYWMNWAVGEIPWGTVKLPEGIQVHKSHLIEENGCLQESYIFKNEMEFPVYFRESDLGVILSFPDSYVDSDECMRRHCHTHIWCGEEASWIKAVRMSGIAPHLGMILRRGSLKGYSVMRDFEKSSNDRGSFLLHPGIDMLQPGEEYELCFEWFWFQNPDAFQKILLEQKNLPVVCMEQSTYFVGETALFHIKGKGKAETVSVSCEEEQLEWKMEEAEDKYIVTVEMRISSMGEKHINIEVNGIHTRALLYGCMKLERLIENRCNFIAAHQQENKGILDGGYIIYDRETKKRFYSYLYDYNGGRERLAMGALIALWLQEKSDVKLESSLNRYIEYVYRELFDTETGDVFNDAGRNMDWDRLYNYPWMTIFLMEVYKWKKDKKYILDAYKSLARYYEKDGKKFYAIGIPATELISCLEKEKLYDDAEKIKTLFLAHAEHVKETGLQFPKSEVNYEQSIVAPAVSILLQAYELTENKEFLSAAGEMMAVLKLFNGQQPDYHLFENAIRHWDGYWFGKRRCFGDTFPHYWSVLTGECYARYSQTDGQEEYAQLAKASLRGCLNLFKEDGWASCAMVYPESINGVKAHYYDPFANDQDWALYYAWKMKAFV